MYAHGDYLQLLAEFGLVGAALFVFFLCTHLWAAIAFIGEMEAFLTARGRNFSLSLALVAGAIFAIVALAVHSIFDFNLQVPGNALVVAFLMPLTLYPVYWQTANDPGLAAYWRHFLALPFWPCGPMWFLWPLLLWDVLAAAVYPLLSRHRETVLRLSAYARRHPGRFLAGFVIVSVVPYVPLALIFGPSVWGQRGTFSRSDG